MVESMRAIVVDAWYRHLKRKTLYVAMGLANVQASHPIKEGDSVVVYRSVEDGSLTVRPEGEFLDGRFERAN